MSDGNKQKYVDAMNKAGEEYFARKTAADEASYHWEYCLNELNTKQANLDALPKPNQNIFDIYDLLNENRNFLLSDVDKLKNLCNEKITEAEKAIKAAEASIRTKENLIYGVKEPIYQALSKGEIGDPSQSMRAKQ